MTFRKFGSLIVDVERIFAVDVIEKDPLRVKIYVIGAPALEIDGDAANLLLEDAMTWLD